MPDFGKDKDGKTAAPTVADVDDYLPVLTGSKLTRATPNFAGLSLRRAMELARVSRVNVDVHGGGYVVAQEPAAGAPLNHATVKLTSRARSSRTAAPRRRQTRASCPHRISVAAVYRPSGESETW